MCLFFDVLFHYEYYNVYSSTRARDNGCSARHVSGKIRRKGRGGARGGGGLGKRKKIRKKNAGCHTSCLDDDVHHALKKKKGTEREPRSGVTFVTASYVHQPRRIVYIPIRLYTRVRAVSAARGRTRDRRASREGRRQIGHTFQFRLSLAGPRGRRRGRCASKKIMNFLYK